VLINPWFLQRAHLGVLLEISLSKIPFDSSSQLNPKIFVSSMALPLDLNTEMLMRVPTDVCDLRS
jgi:hypothetical protein